MKAFYTVKDVEKILNVKSTKARMIIRSLNEELNNQGYLTIQGRCPSHYFRERYFVDGNNNVSDFELLECEEEEGKNEASY